MKLAFALTLLFSLESFATKWTCAWYRNHWRKDLNKPRVAVVTCGEKPVYQCIGVARCVAESDTDEEHPDYRLISCDLDEKGGCGEWSPLRCRHSEDMDGDSDGISEIMTLEAFAKKRREEAAKKIADTHPRKKSDDQPHDNDSDVASKNR